MKNEPYIMHDEVTDSYFDEFGNPLTLEEASKVYHAKADFIEKNPETDRRFWTHYSQHVDLQNLTNKAWELADEWNNSRSERIAAMRVKADKLANTVTQIAIK